MVVVQLSTEADFQSKVKGSGAKLAVVDFYATWCGPCKMISPKLEKMSEDFADVLFFKVDVDELDTVAQSCGVSAMPTFQFFKNGEKVDELVGASEEKLKAMITKNK